jgi:hypothetical protein
VQESYTFETAWYDLNGDSYPELFFVNDFAPYRHSVLLWNEGGTSFSLGDSSCNGFLQGIFAMGFAVGDLNGDRVPDSIVTSYKDIGVLVSLASANPSCNATEPYLWIESSASAGIEVRVDAGDNQQSYGWGTELADFDNDADLDAVIGYGWWSSYPANHEDQPDNLYLNDGDGTFTDHSIDPLWNLADRSATRGVLAADLNHDGWMDLLKRDLMGPTLLRIANCGASPWVEVALAMPAPNTHAVGARIDLTVGGVTQTRWIESGSRSLYVGGPPEAHFGLGTAETIDRLEITWPDGEISRFFALSARQRYTISR